MRRYEQYLGNNESLDDGSGSYDVLGDNGLVDDDFG